MPGFEMRQDLREKRLVGVGRDRADEGFRPGEGFSRIGRYRRQSRRSSPSGAVQVNRERFPNGLDAGCELGMLPKQDIEPRERQARRLADRGTAATENRYSLSSQD